MDGRRGRWSSAIFLTALVTLIAAAGATIMFLRRTVESLEFVSMHGGATLVSVAGGIGSARAGKKFFIELIKSINAAKAARPQERPQFLRDEMREHHRLRELGVLSEEQYEAEQGAYPRQPLSSRRAPAASPSARAIPQRSATSQAPLNFSTSMTAFTGR